MITDCEQSQMIKWGPKVTTLAVQAKTWTMLKRPEIPSPIPAQISSMYDDWLKQYRLKYKSKVVDFFADHGSFVLSCRVGKQTFELHCATTVAFVLI